MHGLSATWVLQCEGERGFRICYDAREQGESKEWQVIRDCQRSKHGVLRRFCMPKRKQGKEEREKVSKKGDAQA